MSLQVEKLEHNMAKLTIESTSDELEKSLQKAYLKNRGKINVPGFRKGKAPRQLIEKMYGPSVFYEDAANDLIYEAYSNAVKEADFEITSRPKIDVTQIEKGKPFIFTAEVAMKPPVELGKYKGVKVEKADTAVSAKEVDEEIKKEQERNARFTDITGRAVKKDDTVNIDYSGSVDGVNFDGGTAEGQELVIGSHSFIDTFEDQIIGKKIGDSFDVNVTFPEQYQEKSLAGKAAVFAVKLNGIKEKVMPELDDEFAGDVSEFSTMAEYKDDVKKKLAEKKEASAKAKKEDEIVKAIVADSKIDIPQAMIDKEAQQMIENYSNRLRQQGLSIEQYMQFTGMTADKLKDEMGKQAKLNIESRLVLEAVADAEKIEATDDEYENEVKKMAEQYHMEPDKFKDILGEEETKTLKKDIVIQKAVDLVLAESKEEKTAKKAAEEDDDAIEKKAAPKKRAVKKTESTDEPEEKKPARKSSKKDAE